MHNFQTGIFKSKKRRSGDFAKFLKHPTSAQLNFLHEFSMQHLGHKPSRFWAHQTFPWRLQGFSPEAFQYLADATRQPIHEFQRRMLHDSHLAKQGSGIISTVGHVVSEGAEYGARLINRVGNFLAHHENTISNMGRITNTVSTLGALSGLISADTHKRITSATSHVVKKKKTGGGWVDYN